MDSNIISLREFARRLGIGEKTIRDGVKLGKISKGVIYENDKPKIVYDIALKEAQEIGLGSKVTGLKPEFKQPKKQPKQPVDIDEIENIAGLGPETSFITATRAEKIYKAQLACLEVDQKAGTLVNKADVYSQLFEFGTEIRTEFESLPGRIGSKVASLGSNVSEIEKLLANEIRNSLAKLVNNLGNRKIE